MQEAASQHWQSQRPVIDPVTVTIDYFCYDASPDLRHALDVDNVPKPILDALKGLVYADDKQVCDLVCRRRNLHETLRVSSAPSRLLPFLEDTLEFVYVSVTHSDPTGVAL